MKDRIRTLIEQGKHFTLRSGVGEDYSIPLGELAVEAGLTGIVVHLASLAREQRGETDDLDWTSSAVILKRDVLQAALETATDPVLLILWDGGSMFSGPAEKKAASALAAIRKQALATGKIMGLDLPAGSVICAIEEGNSGADMAVLDGAEPPAELGACVFVGHRSTEDGPFDAAKEMCWLLRHAAVFVAQGAMLVEAASDAAGGATGEPLFVLNLTLPGRKTRLSGTEQYANTVQVFGPRIAIQTLAADISRLRSMPGMVDWLREPSR